MGTLTFRFLAENQAEKDTPQAQRERVQASLEPTHHLITLKSATPCPLWGIWLSQPAPELRAWPSKPTVLADLGTQELGGLGTSVSDHSGHWAGALGVSIPLTLQRRHFTNEKMSRERGQSRKKRLDPRLRGPLLVSSVCSQLASLTGTDCPQEGTRGCPWYWLPLGGSQMCLPHAFAQPPGVPLKEGKSFFFLVKEPSLDHLSQLSSRMPSSRKPALISSCPRYSPPPASVPGPAFSTVVWWSSAVALVRQLGFKILPFSHCGLWDLRSAPSPC